MAVTRIRSWPSSDDPREEALKRLDERAARFAVTHAAAGGPARGRAGRAARPTGSSPSCSAGCWWGWRWDSVVDQVLGTAPWGLIGGVLLGFALSIYMARRTANRLMAQARQEQGRSR